MGLTTLIRRECAAFLEFGLVDLAASETFLEDIERRLRRRQRRRVGVHAAACPPRQHDDQRDQPRDEYGHHDRSEKPAMPAHPPHVRPIPLLDLRP